MLFLAFTFVWVIYYTWPAKPAALVQIPIGATGVHTSLKVELNYIGSVLLTSTLETENSCDQP